MIESKRFRVMGCYPGISIYWHRLGYGKTRKAAESLRRGVQLDHPGMRIKIVRPGQKLNNRVSRTLSKDKTWKIRI